MSLQAKYLRNICQYVLLSHIPECPLGSWGLTTNRLLRTDGHTFPSIPFHLPHCSALRNRLTNQGQFQLVRGFWMVGEAFTPWGIIRYLAAQKLPNRAVQSLKPPPKLTDTQYPMMWTGLWCYPCIQCVTGAASTALFRPRNHFLHEVVMSGCSDSTCHSMFLQG